MVKWLIITIIILITKFILGDLDKGKRKDIFLFISFIAIVVGLTLREANMEQPKGDLDYYYRTYYRAIYWQWNDFIQIKNMEKGYLVLNRLLAFVFPFPRFIFIFQGCAITGAVFYLIRKYSPNVFLSVFLHLSLGLFLFCYTGFRQSLAISMCILAIPFISKKKYIVSIAMIVIACLMHQTAIIFFLLLIFGNLKANRKNIILYFILCISIMLLSPLLIRIGNEVFNKNYHVATYGGIFSGLLTTLSYCICVGLYTVAIFTTKETNKMETLLWNMSYLALALYLGRWSAAILERMSFYFIFSFCLILPIALKKIRNKTTSDILTLLAELLSVTLFVYKVVNNIAS